jgi:hypothetical protein
MFDMKKLEAYLDSLEVNTHLPKPILKPPPRRGVYAPVENPAIALKMDKYDIDQQGDYENVGAPEYPILARSNLNNYPFNGINGAAFWPTYGGINRAPNYPNVYMGNMIGMSMTGFNRLDDPDIAENPLAKINKKIKQLREVPAVKLANPKPSTPARLKSPDYVHTLTAWRGWDVKNGMLDGLGVSSKWQPKRADSAFCKNNTHAAPQMNCGCGYWSFKTFDFMKSTLKSYMNNVKVIGSVEIWGRVIECSNGYRSEFAYPKELWLLEDGMESLSWTYGVPVRRMSV